MAVAYVEIPMTEFARSRNSEEQEESAQFEKGPADLIDDLLDQIWVLPGVYISNGFIRVPQDFNLPADFYLSGLLNIQRNSAATVEEYKNGSVVEIICPLIISDLEIEFECPLTFFCIPLCERASLVAEITRVELELSVFNGNVALDFVRITSMENIKVYHEGLVNPCCQKLLRRTLFNLKREYEEKIKETVTYFICRLMSKILRTFVLDERIQFRCLEEDDADAFKDAYISELTTNL